MINITNRQNLQDETLESLVSEFQENTNNYELSIQQISEENKVLNEKINELSEILEKQTENLQIVCSSYRLLHKNAFKMFLLGRIFFFKFYAKSNCFNKMKYYRKENIIKQETLI